MASKRQKLSPDTPRKPYRTIGGDSDVEDGVAHETNVVKEEPIGDHASAPEPGHQSDFGPNEDGLMNEDTKDYEESSRSLGNKHREFSKAMDSEHGESSESSDDELNDLLGRFSQECNAFQKQSQGRYDINKENINLAGFHESMPEIRAQLYQFCDRALSIFKNANYQDEHTAQITNHLYSIQKLPDPPHVIVGFLGNSGVGKSSLLNSLLHELDFAIVGASGACTNVITLYQPAFKTQKTKYEAKIRFFEDDSLSKIMDDLLSNAWEWTNVAAEKANDDTQRDAETLAQTAVEALVAMFRDHDEFESFESAGNFIRACSPLDLHSVSMQLSSWTAQLLSKSHVDEGAAQVESDSGEDFKRKLEPFVRSPNDSMKPSCWPLVQTVSVGLSSPILNRGVILADLPGLHDPNQMRKHATHNFLQRCEYLFVVAPQLRVEADESVHEHLIHSSRIVNSNKALVCTKIDHAMGTAVDPGTFDATQEDKEDWDQRKVVQQKLKEEISNFQRSLHRFHGKEKRLQKARLERMKSKQECLKTLTKQVLVKMRNKQSLLKMQQIYRSATKDMVPLKVYFVSNTEYVKYQAGGEEDTPTLSLDVVGIRDLRLCALTLPSQRRFEVVFEYWKVQIPDLIYRLNIWCEQTQTPLRQELRNMVAEPVMKVAETWDEYTKQLLDQVQVHIAGYLKTNLPKWERASLSAYSNWSLVSNLELNCRPLANPRELPTRTFSAQCAKFGQPSGKRAVGQPWNEQLLDPVQGMEESWKKLQKSVKNLSSEHLSLKCFELLNTVNEKAKDFPGASQVSVGKLVASVRKKKHEVRTFAAATTKEISDALSRIQYDAMNADHNCYLPLQMRKAYLDCRAHTGKGSGQKRREIIETVITKGYAYRSIFLRVEEEVRKAVAKLTENRSNQLERIFNGLLEDFDTSFTVQEVDDPKRSQLIAQISEFIEETKTSSDGPIRDIFKKILEESMETFLVDHQDEIDKIELWHD